MLDNHEPNLECQKCGQQFFCACRTDGRINPATHSAVEIAWKKQQEGNSMGNDNVYCLKCKQTSYSSYHSSYHQGNYSSCVGHRCSACGESEPYVHNGKDYPCGPAIDISFKPVEQTSIKDRVFTFNDVKAGLAMILMVDDREVYKGKALPGIFTTSRVVKKFLEGASVNQGIACEASDRVELCGEVRTLLIEILDEQKRRAKVEPTPPELITKLTSLVEEFAREGYA